MVEGISELGEGVLLGERYRLARRIELLTDDTERVAGVEYEYWAAQDVADGADVWIQFAAADGVYAEGAALAGAVAALRRINHPAVPALRAFGEYEFELEGELASVGYCAMPAYAGETLAAVLLREELDQAEILAALGQVCEVLELLAEFELVHGHLSAHSVLLTAGADEGYGVVLLDLPASLSLETALESELTAAADVYALAWLVVLALVGPAALEAEFGAGFAVTTELDLLAEQVVLRRRIWAEENLVALGFSAELAAVLLLALGEAGARPRASILTAALRAEWMLYAEGVGGAVAGAGIRDEAVAAAAVLAAAAVAGEAVAEEVAVEQVAAEEIALAEVSGETAAAAETAGAAGRGTSAAAAGVVAAGAAGAAEASLLAEAVGVMGGAGAAQAKRTAAAAASAGAVTELIPRATGTSGSARASRSTRTVSGSVGSVGTSSGGTGPGRGARKRPRPGVLIGTGVGVVIVIALIIVFATGGSKGGATAASGALTTSGASASASAGTNGSPVVSASAVSGASPVTSPTAASGGGASTSAGGAGATSSAGTSGNVTFPTTLGTVPASAGQTVQLIQAAVSKAQSELTGTEQGQLNQIVSTLNDEIGSGESLSTGTAQLWALLHSGELPSSFNNYLVQLATYLSASQGS